MLAPGRAPRIYNLFPRLVGAVPAWTEHLPRIAALGFDTVYVNPVHATGRSGSLYDIADHARLDPLFAGEGADGDALLTAFTAAAARHGLATMTDLVLTHVAEEAMLVAQHPDWFEATAGGVARFDYARPAVREAIAAFFTALLRHYIALGFRAFRCVAALQVPTEIWRRLIAAARAEAEDCLFCADTLGAPSASATRLAGAGFDYLFNSIRWWDFRAAWVFDEDAALRRVAPTIGFPEIQGAPRLAADLADAGITAGEDVAAEYRLRYGVASCFSDGILMPMGYEWGWTRPLDNAATRPADAAEEKRFDLSSFIAEMNAMLPGLPALSGTGPRPLPGLTEGAVLGFARCSKDAADWVFTLASRDPAAARDVPTDALLAAAAGRGLALREVTPGGVAAEPGVAITVPPLGLTLVRGEAAVPPALAATPLPPAQLPAEWRADARIAIEDVWPEVDEGRFPVKRVVDDPVEVWADILRDGHDRIAAAVLYRRADAPEWHEAPMRPVDNDRWSGSFSVAENGRYRYTILAWTDHFESWCEEVTKKRDAGQDVALELIEGRHLVVAALERAAAGEKCAAAARGADAVRLRRLLAAFDAADPDERAGLLLSRLARHLMARWPDRSDAVTYLRELDLVVDRERARFAAWYEMFPRSQGVAPGRSATFDDCIERLPEIARLGFDVVYLVPIHPIGRVNRKGRDNALVALPGDPGSPYAIGSAEGGHRAVEPGLGTLADFRRFVAAAGAHGMEVALDFAIQCAPDHPWVREHPEWFNFRPDGSIKYAENPPKKYQDIVNVDFYNADREGLWRELRDTILFWAEQGVRIFRVDNPHTKPVPFWEWCIREVLAQYPDVLFLSEAFTRPKMMRLLAKAGFTQSYSYFTWRNTKSELTTYLTELTQGPEKEYMQPNFFTNTPDILPRFLQEGGRPAFRIRLALAATLSPSYGIYNGFELCEATAIPNSEEYLHSEKYEYKVWDWDRPGNIKDDIAALNRFRRTNPAMRLFTNLVFCPTYDEHMLAYMKLTPDRANMVLVVVNLDPVAWHEAAIDLPIHLMGLTPNDAVLLEEAISGASWSWRGPHHRLGLDPAVQPAMVFRVTPTG